jgi:hypothetical protein
MQDDETKDRRSAPTPSPEEIQAKASSPHGGWSAKQMAEWGYAWPPPKGWRQDLKERHRLGLPIYPLDPTPKKARDDPGPADAPVPASTPSASTASASTPSPVRIRDTGEIDPRDPPPWLE